MPNQPKNILFIMCDQLRWDYLSCYGHPRLSTPNIDALAARGVRFTRAYVQSPICGASRMSTYTGRYVQSHGASWNGFPLKVGELTMGDYLRPLGMRTALVGKTHMAADIEGMQRLGIDPKSIIGVLVSECGFEPFERDDGLHAIGPEGRYDPRQPRYNSYLNDQGYDGDNPWHDWANAAGRRQSAGVRLGDAARAQAGAGARGGFRDAVHDPARHRFHRARPATRRGACICPISSRIGPMSRRRRTTPCMGPTTSSRRCARDDERRDPHPVYGAFMEHGVSRTFSRDEVRAAVIPAYMGLIKQIDDQMGVLFRDHGGRRLARRTRMIVFTSDHGDYLGDHWLGDKDFFHEPSVKVPLIIYDPVAGSRRHARHVCDDLVEAIDLAPTFLELAGGSPAQQSHRLEGRSLLPLIRGERPASWRRFTVSEYDYAMQPAAAKLGVAPRDARLFMIADKRWKLIHAIGFRPMLFDLASDPDELHDLGTDPAYAGERDRLEAALAQWGLRQSQRTTRSDQQILNARGKTARRGILIGIWDESDIPAELWTAYDRAID